MEALLAGSGASWGRFAARGGAHRTLLRRFSSRWEALYGTKDSRRRACNAAASCVPTRRLDTSGGAEGIRLEVRREEIETMRSEE